MPRHDISRSNLKTLQNTNATFYGFNEFRFSIVRNVNFVATVYWQQVAMTSITACLVLRWIVVFIAIVPS